MDDKPPSEGDIHRITGFIPAVVTDDGQCDRWWGYPIWRDIILSVRSPHYWRRISILEDI